MRRPSLFKKQQQRQEETQGAQVIEFALDPTVPSENAQEEAPIDDPPDGGYGWVVCGAVSLINGFTWGVAAVCIEAIVIWSTVLTKFIRPTASICLTTFRAHTSLPQRLWTMYVPKSMQFELHY